MNLSVSPVGLATPYAMPSEPPPAAKKAASKRLPHQLRVLLVEDDDGDVYLIRRALGEMPRVTEVRVARDGVEALSMLDLWSTGPDLAIIDLKMPRKDGLALLREISTRKNADFPAVVLTSSRAGADAYRAKKRGAAEFLTKPSSVEKLHKALNEVITRL
jgi:CheY-like chemotaxis protein